MGLLALVSLSGCEPPLSLNAVERVAAQPVRRTDEFQAAASNGGVIVVVGNHGVVLASHDAGKNWQRTVLKGWPSMIGVTACHDLFAAISYEGALWTSRNNGATWQSLALGGSARPQAVTCAPDGAIWVVGESATIMASRDAGAHWQSSSVAQQDLFLTAVQFLDATHGYVFGEFGTALKTTDGGVTWQPLPALPAQMYPEAALFQDINHGWVIGLSGVALETSDAGEHWVSAPTNHLGPLYGIALVGSALYAVGGDGVILERGAHGWTAQPRSRFTHAYLRVVLPADDRHFIVGGGAGSLALLPIDSVSSAATSSDGAT